MNRNAELIDVPDSLSGLQSVFRAKGFYHKPKTQILTQLVLHFLTAATGILLLLLGGHWALQVLGFVLFTAGQVGMATNTHTSAHYATSDRRWQNQALTFLGYPLFLGLGATYWWQKHNVRHHGSPNVIEIDEDAQLEPLFAFTQETVRKAGPLKRFYYRYQWISLPLIAFMALQLQLNSVRHLLRTAVKGEFRGVHWIDLAALTGYWSMWLVVPMLFLPVSSVLIFFALRIVVMSLTLFAIFAPAHVPAEAVALHHVQRGNDNVLLQTATTLNFRTGPVGTWLISGLQHQIEHHLFPAISHVHYPAMSQLLAQYCEKHGYPYRTLGWGEALWKTLGNFLHPKEIESRLAPLA